MGKSALKNATITLVTQIINLLLKFILQRVFVNNLGVEYLGYNSVFTNILQMLNMADLGVGVAITSFLYKPLADNDNDRVSALMELYKNIYHIMGLVVTIIGIIILLLLPIIIPDAACSDAYLRLLFSINLIGTVSTYFMAYNRTLLISQQKAYFVNELDAIANIAFVILQIIFLVIVPNYLIFLILNVGKNIFSNVVVSIKCIDANKFLRQKADKGLIDEYKKPISKYVKDVFVSKIGAYIFYGTDNIVISTFKGSILAGYLSNYSLITTTLQGILSQLFASVQASYGSIVNFNEKNVERQKRITESYFYCSFLLASICLTTLIVSFQQFIVLYIGDKFLLSYSTAILLSVNLYLTILLYVPSQVFVVYRLFSYDKAIVATSAILNIIISIILVRRIGIDGALIGTFITSLIYLFSRIYIYETKVFHSSALKYFLKVFYYFIVSTFCAFSALWISSLFMKDNWGMLIIKVVITLIISGLLSIILTLPDSNSRILIKYIKSHIKKKNSAS